MRRKPRRRAIRTLCAHVAQNGRKATLARMLLRARVRPHGTLFASSALPERDTSPRRKRTRTWFAFQTRPRRIEAKLPLQGANALRLSLFIKFGVFFQSHQG